LSSIIFEMRPVEKKRKRLAGRKSKYDPMLDQFIEGGEDLVEISVEDKKADYVVSQLQRRIDMRELEIEASHAQGFVYLRARARGDI